MTAPTPRQLWLDAVTDGLPDSCGAVTVAVAAALYRHMTPEGACYPSTLTLAWRAKCSPRSVMRHLRLLEAAEFLAVERRGGTVSRYRAVIPSQRQRVTSDRESPVTESPEPVPQSQGVVPQSHSTSDRESHEHLQEHHQQHHQGTPTRAAHDGETLTLVSTNGESAFAAFWAAWPRKVAKPAARKAWKAAVRKAPARVIVEAAERHAAGYAAAGTDRRYVPHPATWLNQERWNDDPPVVSTNGSGRGSGDWRGGKSIDQIAAEATERLRRTMGLDGGAR